MGDDSFLPRDVTYAFPWSITDGKKTQACGGMSLRDYFAGQALTGLLAAKAELSAQDETILAEVAYSYADDMLKAREK